MIDEMPKKEFSVIGMGEVMLRLSPPARERISYCESFEKRAGGSELNVVSGISMLGLRTGIITRLPKNDIGRFVKHKIRYSGTSDDFVTYDDSQSKRLGIYYYECGAYPRQSAVSYDRADSSFLGFRREELPSAVYSSANVFHTSGITLALGEKIRNTTLEIMRAFSDAGALISFDVNYRASLWSEEEARCAVLSVLPLVSVLFVSEETLRRTMQRTGNLREMQRSVAKEYPNIELILSTRRRPVSPREHSFSSLVYDAREDVFCEEAEYESIEVVDRIGSGDAYVAGALYALLTYRDTRRIVEYANAMAALKNTVPGDTAQCDSSDIERIIKNHIGTEPKSEMVR